MPYTYTQFKDRVGEIVRDEPGKLSPAEIANFSQGAVKTYSRHRPRTVVKDITGNGTYDYAISTSLTSWDRELSVIQTIEYPADQRDPQYVDEDDWKIYEKEAGQYLRFLSDTPAATQKIRVSYTALHLLSDTQNTIPDSDYEAVCCLAASLCSGALASIYAHASDSTIGADSVDHRSKSQDLASRANAQKKFYMDHIGVKDGDVSPASAVTHWHEDYPGGWDRLTHPKKWR